MDGGEAYFSSPSAEVHPILAQVMLLLTNSCFPFPVPYSLRLVIIDHYLGILKK